MEGYRKISIMVGGGQDYYGPTAARDKKVVQLVALGLNKLAMEDHKIQIQVITGGMLGVGDDFARFYGGRVLDVVSSEYVETYKKRTINQVHRAYWVAGESQERRRLAFATNPDIALALFVQGGQYTSHEIKIFQENNTPTVLFWGSGGASGGRQPYKGWACEKPPGDAPYMSNDPDMDPETIAMALMNEILNTLSK